MKVLAIVFVFMVVGCQTSQAADLNLQETWDDLVSHVKGLGQHALDKMKEMARHVSNETLQKLINALKTGGETSIGKRQLTLKETWLDLVGHLKGLGQHAIDKLKEMASTVSRETLAKMIKALQTGNGAALRKRQVYDDIEELLANLKTRFPQVADKIQELQDKFPIIAKEVLSRYEELKDRLPFVVEKVLALQQQITDKLQGHADNLKDVLGQAANQLKDIFEEVKKGNGRDKLAAIFGKVKATVGLAKRSIDRIARQVENDFIGQYMESLTNELSTELPNIVSRRDTDLVRRAVNNKFNDFFKPHLEKLKEHVAKIGDLAKDHAGDIHATLKDHINQLQGKLQVHVDKMKEHGNTMVGHGTNAVTALKNAVTQILGETFINMAGTTIDALGTIKDAINTISDHVADATNVTKKP